MDATIIFNLTWDRPLIGVPANNTISVSIGYGIINGTCFDTDYGKYPIKNDSSTAGTVILEFNFNSLQGTGNIALDNYTTLVLQIDTFDVDNMNPNLIKPHLPLPDGIIINIMKDVVNASIPLLNDYFQSHGFELPRNYTKYIPYPQISVYHQKSPFPNDTVTTHGYVELLSKCACTATQDALYQPCNGLATQCSQSPTSQRTPLSQTTTSAVPAVEQTRSLFRRGLLSKSTTIANTNHTMRSAITNNASSIISSYKTASDQIWWHVFDIDETSNTNSSSDDELICDILNAGDVGYITLLSNTNGVCQVIPVLEEIKPDFGYYSLTITATDSTNPTIQQVSLFCNQGCQFCGYTSATSESTIKFGDCYKLSSILNGMFLHVNDVGHPCLGGNAHTAGYINSHNKTKFTNQSSVISINYNDTKTCNSSNNKQIVTLQNLGKIYNQCKSFAQVVLEGTYEMLQSIATNGTSKMFNLYTECNQSTCSATGSASDTCETVYSNLEYKTCQYSETKLGPNSVTIVLSVLFFVYVFFVLLLCCRCVLF